MMRFKLVQYGDLSYNCDDESFCTELGHACYAHMQYNTWTGPSLAQAQGI